MIFKGFFMTCGIGIAKNKLAAFDCSLINAKVGDYNHIRVSSILSGKIKQYDHVPLKKGSAVYSAYAHISSNEIDSVLSACVAVGIPKKLNEIGMIMEHSAISNIEDVKNTAIQLVKDSMELRGIEISKIISSPVTLSVPKDKYLSVFSAIVMW
jgi:arginine decarboxylase